MSRENMAFQFYFLIACIHATRPFKYILYQIFLCHCPWLRWMVQFFIPTDICQYYMQRRIKTLLQFISYICEYWMQMFFLYTFSTLICIRFLFIFVFMFLQPWKVYCRVIKIAIARIHLSHVHSDMQSFIFSGYKSAGTKVSRFNDTHQ